MQLLTGLYLNFGTQIDARTNSCVYALARSLLVNPPTGITDIVPSYTTLYVEYNPRKLARRTLLGWIENRASLEKSIEGRMAELPVRYDGVDLGDIAREVGLSVTEVARRHSDQLYRVYALGFTPGFPFMGEVDPSIRQPRRNVPRERVDAHTVAMAGAQTGIYPLASPGGWNLLGTVLKAIYDPHRPEPFALGPGDTVQFLPADGPTPATMQPLELLPTEPKWPLLCVHKRGLYDLVVDSGRFFAGRFGLARSGPLDARSAVLANRLLGNNADTPVIELNVLGPTLGVLADGVLAFAGWGVTPRVNGEAVEPFTSFAVRRGDIVKFQPQRHGVRGYLAAAGGFESGTFLGSSSVDVRGLIGRPLAPGDVLGVRERRASRAGFGFRPYGWFDGTVTLRLVPGPQASVEALAALTDSTFTVSRSDRMGLHLEGALVPGGDMLSEATPLGAVQVTAGGLPLVLLNDRGTLGGYEKPAVVHPADLPRAAQLRAGDQVCFVRAGGAVEVMEASSLM